MAVVTPTDRPQSVRNCCLIELLCGVVCVVTLPFWHFCWFKAFLIGLVRSPPFCLHPSWLQLTQQIRNMKAWPMVFLNSAFSSTRRVKKLQTCRIQNVRCSVTVTSTNSFMVDIDWPWISGWDHTDSLDNLVFPALLAAPAVIIPYNITREFYKYVIKTIWREISKGKYRTHNKVK